MTDREHDLGPLSFRRLIASSFRLYRSTWSRLAPASMAVGVVLFWLPLVSFALWRNDAPESLWVGIFIARESFFQLLASLIVALGGALIASDLVGDRRSLPQVYRELSPLRAALLGAALYSMLLGGFAHLVPFFGLILPLILLGPVALAQVVSVEKEDLTEARARARVLLPGNLMRLFTYLLPVAVAVRLLEGILYSVVVGVGVGAAWGTPAVAVLQGAASAAFIGLVLIPFMTAVLAALYFDLRARAGDLDEDALDGARATASDSTATPG